MVSHEQKGTFNQGVDTASFAHCYVEHNYPSKKHIAIGITCVCGRSGRGPPCSGANGEQIDRSETLSWRIPGALSLTIKTAR
jgi:hypothetical protein